MYEVQIRRQAKKKLVGLPPRQRTLIAEGIQLLALDPDDIRLDTKKLLGRNEYRLRIGSWRVIYERDDYLNIISIEKISSRGDVYK